MLFNDVLTLRAASGAVVRPERRAAGAAEKNGGMRADRNAVGAAVVSSDRLHYCTVHGTLPLRHSKDKTRSRRQDQTRQDKTGQ